MKRVSRNRITRVCVRAFTETTCMQTSLQPEGEGSTPLPLLPPLRKPLVPHRSQYGPVLCTGIAEGTRITLGVGQGRKAPSVALLPVGEYRKTHSAAESVLSTAQLACHSCSVATNVATEQEVAIALCHLIAQLSDVGNEPFDFLYSTGGDFLPTPPRDF